MLRVACLVPHPRESPSSRIRVAQYAPLLRQWGIELELLSFFDEGEYARLYRAGPGRRIADTAGGFHRRLRQLRRARDADAVLIHREVAPFAGAPLLRALDGGPPVLFDLDDAVFLPAAGGSRWLRLLRRAEAETAALVRRAQVCLAGNAYLADFVRRAGGRAIQLPTTVDTDVFQARGAPRDPRGPLKVSWVGTHSTQGYLDLAGPALRTLSAERPVEITVVSNRPPQDLAGVPVRGVRWSLDAELTYFQDADVGIYPLPDDAWTRGKCGGKAVQYMACEVPLVASPVGVLKDLVRDGETGFVAGDGDAWVRALRSLAEDPGLRRRLGSAGRALIEVRYSLRKGAEILADAIQGVVGGGRRVGARGGVG
jgi:glycosyltransferase involved in cell wall biosynthesis